MGHWTDDYPNEEPGPSPTPGRSPEAAGWLEAAIAWEVCASIHRAFGKGKDALFTTRQADFVKHAEDARRKAKGGV